MQLVPLKLLKPYENKEFTLDLLKDTNLNETPNKKPRGKIVVDLTFVPFKEDSSKFGGPSEGYSRKESGIGYVSDDEVQDRAGLLSVVILEAEEVEGEHHNNPFAVLTFRGEKKKTKVINLFLQYKNTSFLPVIMLLMLHRDVIQGFITDETEPRFIHVTISMHNLIEAIFYVPKFKFIQTMKKTRHPRWNEEFQFMLEEPPQHEKIHIEVLSRRKNFSFLSKVPFHYPHSLQDIFNPNSKQLY